MLSKPYLFLIALAIINHNRNPCIRSVWWWLLKPPFIIKWLIRKLPVVTSIAGVHLARNDGFLNLRGYEFRKADPSAKMPLIRVVIDMVMRNLANLAFAV